MSKDGNPKAGNGVDTSCLPDLPKGWSWAFVDELGEVVTGSTPSKTRPEYYGGQIPLFKPTDLNAGYNVRGFADSLTEVGAQQARLLPPDTVLVTCIGATIGKTGLARVKCATNQQINALVLPREAILPEWAYWYFISNFAQRQIRDNASATTLPILNKTKFGGLPFPLAPTLEQHRIVAKLEELISDLDAGVAALERAKANLKRYRAAVLKAAVEGKLTEEWRAKNPPKEPAVKLLERILKERRQKWEQHQLAAYAANGKQPPKNWRDKYQEPAGPDTTNLPALPEGWCWAAAGQLSDIQGGLQKQPKRTPKDNAFPYLRVANVHRDRLDLSEMSYFELFGDELSKLRLERGDLLVVEGNGSKTEIGRSALWRGEIENCVHQNHIIRVRFQSGSPEFLNIYWNSPLGNTRIMEKAASTSGLYTLSVAKVSSLPIPLPPPDEQTRISTEVEDSLSVLQQASLTIELNLKRASRLRQSILQRAFEGRLVPRDATDEPATAILSRIAAERQTTAGDTKLLRRSNARGQIQTTKANTAQ